MDKQKKTAYVKNGKAYQSQFPHRQISVTAFDALKDDQRMDSVDCFEQTILSYGNSQAIHLLNLYY